MPVGARRMAPGLGGAYTLYGGLVGMQPNATVASYMLMIPWWYVGWWYLCSLLKMPLQENWVLYCTTTDGFRCEHIRIGHKSSVRVTFTIQGCLESRWTGLKVRSWWNLYGQIYSHLLLLGWETLHSIWCSFKLSFVLDCGFKLFFKFG